MPVFPLTCIWAINLLLKELGLCNTKINSIPSKTKNIFMDQSYSSNTDTKHCSNDTEHAFYRSITDSVSKWKKEGPESFDLVDLEKTSILCCQYSHLFHHMSTDSQERNQEKEGNKISIPIKSTPIRLIPAMHETNSTI